MAVESFPSHDIMSSNWLCKVFFLTAPQVIWKPQLIENSVLSFDTQTMVQILINPLCLTLATFLPDALLSGCYLFFIPSPWHPPDDLWPFPSTPTCSQWASLPASFSRALSRLMHYISFLSSNPLARLWPGLLLYRLLSLRITVFSPPAKAVFPAPILLLGAPNHRPRSHPTPAPGTGWQQGPPVGDSLLFARLSGSSLAHAHL